MLVAMDPSVLGRPFRAMALCISVLLLALYSGNAYGTSANNAAVTIRATVAASLQGDLGRDSVLTVRTNLHDAVLTYVPKQGGSPAGEGMRTVRVPQGITRYPDVVSYSLVGH